MTARAEIDVIKEFHLFAVFVSLSLHILLMQGFSFAQSLFSASSVISMPNFCRSPAG